jgi:nucleotide-binding universal stress UspA family protein
MKEVVRKSESYPMNQWFTLNCDRYGHLITSTGGSSSRTDQLCKVLDHEPTTLTPRSVQSVARRLEKPAPFDSQSQTAAEKSPVRHILVPIDAAYVEAADLKPILRVARRFNAEVTLLHCYSTPPSFDYVVGPSAMVELSLHRSMIRARLLKLCTNVQKFFPRCRSEFTFGSLPVAILRASETLQADLIAVPLSLDFVSHCWTTKELLDELVRRANCAVLGVPSA